MDKKQNQVVVALIMIVTVMTTLFWPAYNAYAGEAYYRDTETSHVMDNLGQSLESTENTGRIWTDKSVAESGMTTFSVGANAQEVIGKTSKPTDTVIILDVSQGMLSTEKDKTTGQVVYKIQSALEAANNTIDQLMNANEYNRVSVVAYSGKRLDTDNEVYNPNDNQVVELLPLAHYRNRKPIDEEYLTLECLNVKEKGVSFDPVNKPEGIVQSHAWKQGDTEEISFKAYLGGMSNLQYGLSKGMDVLAKATETQVDGHTRQPNVLLFMGSLPQESCADQEWWNPTLTKNSNIQYCDRSTNDAAHTVKAIMVGAYQKKQIEKHYGVKASLLVSQIFITTETKEKLAFTSEDWKTVSMSEIPLQDIVNAYVKNTSYDIPAGLQNNKPGAVYTLNQHPDTADDITANEIFNYIDAGFTFNTQDFEQAKVIKGTSDIIKDTITDVEVPLEKGSFVTYTDPIGEYMNIVPYNSNHEGSGINFKFASDNGSDVDIVFTKETVQGDGTIVYEDPVAKQNIDNLYHTVYGTKYAEELKKVSIRLEDNNGKKTLVAKIPATLIPMGMSTVRYDESGKLESMKRTKDESAKPFKLIYQVKIDKTIYDSKSEKLIDEKVEADYLKQNANADGSKVYFYSTYKGEDTQVEFTPSLTNHYYYFTEDTPAYRDENCTNPVGAIDPEATYYYKEEYFNGSKAYTKVKTVKGSDVIQDKGHIAKGTFKHLNINAQTVKKNNTHPGDMVVNDYVSQLKADGNTIKNTFGNIVVYRLAKPDKYPKELVLTYDALNEDKDLLTYVQADTTTSFDIWVDSTTEGKISGKIVDKDGNETVLDNLSVKGNYVKDNGNPISLKLGDKLYLNGENFDPNKKVKVTVANTSPTFLDKASMTKESTLELGTNEIVINPKILPKDPLPTTKVGFNVQFKGEGKSNIPFNFTWNGEKNAAVEGTIPQVTISSSAEGTTGIATATVKAPLGTSSIYIRQGDFQPGIIYDEGILKVNLKTEIKADGNYETSVAGYEKGSYAEGVLAYTPIDDINNTPAFTNTVTTESGTKVVVSGKLSLKKASTKVSGADNITGKTHTGVKYDQVMEAGEYKNPIQFTIEPVGTEAPFELPIVTVDGSGMFSMVSPALAEGTYTYKITPVAAKGIEYDTASNLKTITITVDGSGNGTWKVDGNDPLEFNGTYKPTGTITLNYKNNLTGRRFFGTERVIADPTTLEYNGTKVNDTIDKITIESTPGQSSVSQSRDMSVYLPGEYVFRTKMEEGTGKHTMFSNVTCYDLGGKKLTVQVVDNMDGTLSVPTENNFELNWEYRPAQQMVETENILVKADGFHLKAGEFQYQVTPLNGAPIGIYSSPISNPEMESDTKQATINRLKFQFTGKEITDQFDKQDITGYQDHKATFSYEIKELNKGSTLGHDQSVYRIDITFSMNSRAQIEHAKGNKSGTIVTTITKIKDSNGNDVNEPVKGAMVFNHKVANDPVQVGLDQDINLEASLSGRSSIPLKEKEITLKAGALKSTDPAIDITKPNENVQIYKDGKVITAGDFAKDFSVQNDASGRFVITDYKVEFKKPGIYKLNLEPTNLAEELSYVGTKSAIKYVVTEENGELKVHVSNEFGMNTLRYYFEYHPSETIDIYVQENLTGRDWIPEDEIISKVKHDGESDQLFSIKNDTPNHKVKVATVTLGESSSVTYTITNEIKTGGGLVKTPKDGKVESKVLKITSADADADGVLEITVTLDEKPINISTADPSSENRKIEIGFDTQYKILNKEQKNLVTVKEIFKGRENDTWLDKDQFTFTLSPYDEVTTQAIQSGEITVSNDKVTLTGQDADYKVQFGDFIYTKSGNYKFLLVQETPSMPAVSAAETPSFILELKVDDDLQGALLGTIEKGDTYEFKNTYGLQSVSTDITLPNGSVKVQSGDGKVENAPPLKDKQFEFQLKDKKNHTVATSSNDADGSVSFKDLKFDKAGTYKYTVVNSNIKDPESKYWKLGGKLETTVTVEVKDNNEGNLVVVSTSINVPKFVFNYYVSDARVTTSVSKILNGRDWKSDDVFEFILAPKKDYGNNVKMPKDTTVSITGKDQVKEASFEDIIFSHVGTYTFNISEIDNKGKGITYDTSKKEIQISVTDNEKGSLTAKVIGGSLENTFTNTYAVTPVTISGKEVKKDFTGRLKNAWLDTDAFTFTLAADDDVTKDAVERKEIILKNSQITITDKTPGNQAAFGDITFNKEGSYQFVVKETKGSIPGVIYDESVKTVNVKVTDDFKGNLTAKVNEDPLIFKNIYNITGTVDGQISFAPGTVMVKGSKGAQPQLQKDQFTFEMKANGNYAKDAVELPKNITAVNAEDGSIVFDKITFKKPGVYTFSVQQDKKDAKGWTYDTSVKDITFTVMDNNEGALKVDKVEGLENQNFTNQYAPMDVAIKGPEVSKTLEGRDWKTGDLFTFTIKEAEEYGTNVENGNQALAIKEEDKIKAKSFNDIIFKHTGTYQFTVAEEKPNTVSNGIVYDTTPRTVTVEVKDDQLGNLTANVKEGSNNNFINNYVPKEAILSGAEELIVTKNIIGRPWMEGDKFRFMLKINPKDPNTLMAFDEGLIELKDDTRITINADSKDHQAAFGDIVFKTTGDYQFQVVEQSGGIPGIQYSKDKKYFTVHVYDNQEGMLVAEIVDPVSFVFDNQYKAQAATDNITAKVKVKSEKGAQPQLQKDQFTFKMKAKDNYAKDAVELPDNMTAVNAEDGSIVFDKITFKKPGTYTFEVQQDKKDAKGWTYDTSVKTVTFNVRDNYLGQIEVQSTGLNADFLNTYAPSDAVLKGLGVSKTLTGRNWKKGDLFTFTLNEAEEYGTNVENGNQVLAVKEEDPTKAKSFNDIIFKHTGTYQFTVVEEKPNTAINGVVYDTVPRTVTVEVTDDQSGSLTAKISKGNLENSFENKYYAGAVILDGAKNLTVTKELTGRKDNKWLDTDEFNFTIEAGNDVTKAAVERKEVVLSNSQILITSQTKDHKATFGDVVFKKAGDYQFVVKETKGSIPGITYDDGVKTVNVKVTENYDSGELEVKVTGDRLVFHNTYDYNFAKGQIQYNVKVTGSKGTEVQLQKDQFTFKLSASDRYTEEEVTLPKDLIVKNAEDGRIVFDQITFKKPGVYTFEVQQDTSSAYPGWKYDTSVKKVTFTVRDDNEGGLSVVTDGMEDADFTNSYEPEDAVLKGAAELKVQKILTGRNWKTEDSFEFTLAPEKDYGDSVTMPKETTVSITDKNKVKEASFGDIIFHKTGIYTFMISEKDNGVKGITYDQSVKTITFEITDNGKGALVLTKQSEDKAPYYFANTYLPKDAVLEGSTDLAFSNTVEGRQWKDGETYTFTLAPVTKDAPMPEEAVLTVSKPVKGNTAEFYFKNITYTNDDMKDANYTADGVKFKTFEYTLTETSGDTGHGMTYDTVVRKITVTVSDKGDGTLTVTSKITGNKEFINSYHSSFVYDDLQIEKTMVGKDMAKDQFAFLIKACNNESAVKMGKTDKGDILKVSSPSADDGKTVTMIPFAGIKLTQDDAGKTFVYEISEENGSAVKNGVQYDPSVYTVEIAVSDDLEGHLRTVTTICKDGQIISSVAGDKPAVVSFVNKYFAEGTLGDNKEGSVKIVAENILSGRQQNEGEFKFQVKDSKGNVVATASNKGAADGKPAPLTFTPIHYTSEQAEEDVRAGIAQKDTDGSYSYPYTVEEITTEEILPESVIPVSTEYQIIVKVKDAGDGSYHIAVVYPDSQDHLTFENNYDPTIVNYHINGTIKLTVPEGGKVTIEDLAGKYEFEIQGVSMERAALIPMPEKTTTTNDAAGNIDFGKITYTTDLLENVQPDANGIRSIKYRYRIIQTGKVAGITKEQQVDSFAIILKAGENNHLTATLVREADSGSILKNEEFEFVNIYKFDEQQSSTTDSGKYIVKKVLSGRELQEAEFTFEMKDKDNNVVSTGVNKADGSVYMSPITFKHPGTYSYVLSEVNGGKTLENGVTYDAKSVEIIAVVTDNKDGTMNVAWDTPFDHTITFKNSYQAQPTAVTLSANKYLAGRTMKAGEFSFVLKDEKGNELQKKKNDERGAVLFDEITYDKAGSWNYTVEEVKGTDKDIKYDDRVYHLTVQVTDDQKGHLVTEVINDGDETVFRNIYTGTPGPVDPDKPGPEDPDKPGSDKPGSEEPGTPGPEEPGTPGPEEPGTPGPEEPGTPGQNPDQGGIKTADESALGMWAVILIGAAAGIASVLIFQKRKKK